MVLAASALLAGAAGRFPSDIAAHRFTLADPKEKTAIAYLRVMKDGSPALFFRDPSGKFRSVLGVKKNGAAAIDFRDRNGKVRLLMGVGADGSPRINFINAAGKLTRTIR